MNDNADSRESSRSSGPRGPRPHGSGPRSSQGGRQDNGGGRSKPRRFPRKKVCRFTQENVAYIDYKNYRLLREFLTERGKIIPRRITGTSARHQRMLTKAIKRARYMALLSFTHR